MYISICKIHLVYGRMGKYEQSSFEKRTKLHLHRLGKELIMIES